MSAVDGVFIYGEAQRSFMFHLDVRIRRSRFGPWPFSCMREWCLERRIDPCLEPAWQYGPAYGRGKSKPPLYLSKVPEEQLSLRRIDDEWVYFVQESGMGAIKIGTAKNVHKRVIGMAVSTPHLLVVLAITYGSYDVERKIHDRFASARIRGEWFHPVPELLEYIAEIKNLTRGLVPFYDDSIVKKLTLSHDEVIDRFVRSWA